MLVAIAVTGDSKTDLTSFLRVGPCQLILHRKGRIQHGAPGERYASTRDSDLAIVVEGLAELDGRCILGPIELPFLESSISETNS